MNAVALDTLKVAKRLRDAGFSEAQAESVTDAIRESVTGGDLASKDDVKGIKDDVKDDIRGIKDDVKLVRADLDTAVIRLESKIETKIAQAQSETLKWMFGMMVAQGAFVVTLIKIFPGK